MRSVGAIFVAAHGLGHVVWFMATWAQWSLGGSGRADLAKHENGFLVPALSGAGKVVGALSLVALVGFLAASWGVWTQQAWWPQVLLASVVPSAIALFAMWNPVGNVSFNALVANALLAAATYMPWGERFLGAH